MQSWPWGLAVLALVLRLTFVLAYEQYPAFLADDRGYDDVAVNLAAGKGFVAQAESGKEGTVHEPVVAFGPVYPAFLALIYALFGHSTEAVRLIQAILGAVTVLVVYYVAAEAFDEQVAHWAGLFAAVHPALIIYSGMLITETLFAGLLVLSVWTVMTAARRDSLPVWFGAGCVAGLAVLLREEALVVAVLVVATVLRLGRPRRNIRQVAAFAIALVLTVGGWTIRNYQSFGEVIPVSANGGKTLWISTMGWDEWRYDDDSYKALVAGLPDVERDRVLRREGIKNILADPLRYTGLCMQRLAAFWFGSHTTYLAGFSESFHAYAAEGAWMKVMGKGLLLAVNIVLLALAVWGAWAGLVQESRRRLERMVCGAPVTAVAVVHFFLFATSRYQVPILPCLLVFTAAGAMHARGYLQAHMSMVAVK